MVTSMIITHFMLDMHNSNKATELCPNQNNIFELSLRT